MSTPQTHFILPFRQLRIKDVSIVGGKNASLGEMVRTLTTQGVRVPDGFAVTAVGYRLFMKQTGVDTAVRSALTGLNTKDLKNLRQRGERVRRLIRTQELPVDLAAGILKAYQNLSRQYGVSNLSVAVRSSATAEDLPDASFAGQQDTYLNVVGEPALLDAVRNAYASLFTDRAISYRVDKGFDWRKVALSVGVQAMVRADRGSSGVMFTIDTESGFKDVVIINAIWGLGENVVQGAVNPDEFIVYKPTLLRGFPAIISKRLGKKHLKMVYRRSSKFKVQSSKLGVPARSGRLGHTTVNVPVSLKDRLRFSLTDEEVLQLARWGALIEQHYGKPMDIEWAKDGVTGKLFVVQARPETVMARKDTNVLETYRLLAGRGYNHHILVEGIAVGSKIGAGKVRVIEDVSGIQAFRKGEVLVTTMTDPDWEPIMKIASAIVTDEGGRTAHAAIVSRELGIPAVVGTETATRVLRNATQVTVSCAEGERGVVYRGKIPFTVERVNVKKLKRPQTQMMMIVGEPEQAFGFAQIPNDGVGLARLEFIISNYVRIHPLALVRYRTLKDKSAQRQIANITAYEKDKRKYFVDQLSFGIARIAAAFYPRDVIVRLSDFKSSEYASLIGGKEFEPDERNPMIGWRGASRYYDPKYRPGFNLECAALKKVRGEMGLTNVKIMVPFCRTVEEGKLVVQALAEQGLEAGVKGLELYVMVEIPSNVIMADKFAEVFDGFSIGSNDLAQLTLGLDRDSGLVAHVGDERNEAVKRMMAMAIRSARTTGTKIGICGQAPSDFPEIAEFLVQHGIDSIALQPDTVLKTTLQVLAVEKKMKNSK